MSSACALAQTEAVPHLPQPAESHRLKAQLLRAQGKYRQAIDECRAALKFSPADRKLQNELAITLFLSQDYKGTLPELEQLLKAQPRSANLNFFVGDSLFETAQIEEAVPYLETALGLDPKLIPAHVALGLCYVRLGDGKKAIPHLKLGLQLDTDGSLYYQLSRAYGQVGQPQLAKAMMDKYQELQKQAGTK
ncbi:MAG: tetratricopeptide repeat protein [Bryobacteraceae bacterium]